MSETKFFFEEDETKENTKSNKTLESDLDFFNSVLKEEGVDGFLNTLEPSSAQPLPRELNKLENPVLEIIYGNIGDDYYIYIFPKHPKKTINENNLRVAVEEVVIAMNKEVPYTLKVTITLPRKEWEIKLMSFIIEGGAVAWNFSRESFEANVIPSIFSTLTDICNKA